MTSSAGTLDILPRELRDRIWGLLLTAPTPITLFTPHQAPKFWLLPVGAILPQVHQFDALVKTSKQVATKAAERFFAINNFTIVSSCKDWHFVHKEVCGVSPPARYPVPRVVPRGFVEGMRKMVLRVDRGVAGYEDEYEVQYRAACAMKVEWRKGGEVLVEWIEKPAFVRDGDETPEFTERNLERVEKFVMEAPEALKEIIKTMGWCADTVEEVVEILEGMGLRWPYVGEPAHVRRPRGIHGRPL